MNASRKWQRYDAQHSQPEAKKYTQQQQQQQQQQKETNQSILTFLTASLTISWPFPEYFGFLGLTVFNGDTLIDSLPWLLPWVLSSFFLFFLPCGGSNGFVLGLPQQRQQPAIVSRLPAAAVTNTRYPLSWLDYTSPSSQFQLINQASTLSIQTNTNEPNHRPKRNTSIYIYIYIYIKKQNKQQQKKNTHVLKLH